MGTILSSKPLLGVPTVPTEELIQSIRQLSSSQIERILQRRQAESEALRALLRAAIARERQERRPRRKAGSRPR